MNVRIVLEALSPLIQQTFLKPYKTHMGTQNTVPSAYDRNHEGKTRNCRESLRFNGSRRKTKQKATGKNKMGGRGCERPSTDPLG